MSPEMKIYHRLFFQEVSNEKFLRILENPVRAYEDEMPDCPIIDIGCGQSSTLLDYLEAKRDLVAVDNEQSQLNYLRKRVENYNPEKLAHWTFLCKSLPDETIFERDYALVILSHLLHFFSLNECIEIGKLIAEKTKSGALIYSRVHSTKHYGNHPEDPNNYDYFKHYFSVEDLDAVFPNEKFEKIYSAEVESQTMALERKIQIKWIEEVCRKAKITDRREITEIKREHFKDQKESFIDTIYRRL